MDKTQYSSTATMLEEDDFIAIQRIIREENNYIGARTDRCLQQIERLASALKINLDDVDNMDHVESDAVKIEKKRKPTVSKLMRKIMSCIPADGSIITIADISERIVKSGYNNKDNSNLSSSLTIMAKRGWVKRVYPGVYTIGNVVADMERK